MTLPIFSSHWKSHGHSHWNSHILNHTEATLSSVTQLPDAPWESDSCGARLQRPRPGPKKRAVCDGCYGNSRDMAMIKQCINYINEIYIGLSWVWNMNGIFMEWNIFDSGFTMFHLFYPWKNVMQRHIHGNIMIYNYSNQLQWIPAPVHSKHPRFFNHGGCRGWNHRFDQKNGAYIHCFLSIYYSTWSGVALFFCRPCTSLFY